MFKVKIKSRDNENYYKVFHIRDRTEPAAYRHNLDITITEFLIHDLKNGFHWVNANLCEPV